MSGRTALQTLGVCGVGAGSIGVMGGMTRAAKFETTTIPDIPTEPKEQVYSFADSQQSWPGDYEISHTMEWFQTYYNGENDSWVHDFSIQSHACSKHNKYTTLIPECTGWGYRIESGGIVRPYVNEEMHGVNPKGGNGDMPEWTEAVMEGAIGTMSTTGSVLLSAKNLADAMDPADGFDTSLDDGFRWLHTYGHFEDGAEQVSSHHRSTLEAESFTPVIDTNATVRIKRNPTGEDKWLDMEVTTTPNGPINGPMSLSSSIHPEDMSTEEIEKLGIKKVTGVERARSTEIRQFSSGTLEDDPQYVMTNCPWSAEGTTNVVKENREPTE